MSNTINLTPITVLVNECKTKDGRTFNTYKAVTKNGAIVDLKFRKEVKNLPTEKSIIWVNEDNVNEQKNAQYPTYWVSQIEFIEPFVRNQEANRKRVREVFGNPSEV